MRLSAAELCGGSLFGKWAAWELEREGPDGTQGEPWEDTCGSMLDKGPEPNGPDDLPDVSELADSAWGLRGGSVEGP